MGPQAQEIGYPLQPLLCTWEGMWQGGVQKAQCIAGAGSCLGTGKRCLGTATSYPGCELAQTAGMAGQALADIHSACARFLLTQGHALLYLHRMLIAHVAICITTAIGQAKVTIAIVE